MSFSVTVVCSQFSELSYPPLMPRLRAALGSWADEMEALPSARNGFLYYSMTPTNRCL